MTVNNDRQGVFPGQKLFVEAEKHLDVFTTQTTGGFHASKGTLFPRFRYAFSESLSGGEMDATSTISYIDSARSYLFVAGGYAYNRKDFGNFVWGASMRKLSFGLFTAQWGAHANAFLNEYSDNAIPGGEGLNGSFHRTKDSTISYSKRLGVYGRRPREIRKTPSISNLS